MAKAISTEPVEFGKTIPQSYDHLEEPAYSLASKDRNPDHIKTRGKQSKRLQGAIPLVLFVISAVNQGNRSLSQNYFENLGRPLRSSHSGKDKDSKGKPKHSRTASNS